MKVLVQVQFKFINNKFTCTAFLCILPSPAILIFKNPFTGLPQERNTAKDY
jgi:hypothetical protein